jgi:hypothetical protein
MDIDSNLSLSSVSCATTTYCMAVDTSDNVFAFHGTSWSSIPDADSEPLESVSCTDNSFCVAVDSGGGALTLIGSTSTYNPNVDPGDSLNAVSCLNATFCVAVDNIGQALTYTAPPPPVVSTVSPATGLDTGGMTVSLTGSGFTGATEVDFGNTPGTNLRVASDNSLTVTSPAGTDGTEDVTVRSTNGISPGSPADQFTYTANESPTVVSCAPMCSVTVSSPEPVTVNASGSVGSGSGTMSLVVNTGSLGCGSTDYTTPVATLSTTGFNTIQNVTVTDKVGDTPSIKGVHVCYAAGANPKGKFLPKCNGTGSNSPCVESLMESEDSVIATFSSPAQDPRFWTGGAPLVLKTLRPNTGPGGTKVTLKGKNLLEAQSVVIAGSSCQITKQTNSTLSFIVPYNALAVTDPITVTAASGEVATSQPFDIS